MPTPTDQQLAADIQEVAENLAGFRVEVAEKFGTVNARLEEKFGTVNARLEGIQVELKLFRWLGVFFAGLLVTLVGGLITVSWNASGVVFEVNQQRRHVDEVRAEVKQQGARLGNIEGRMDGVEKKLDLLIRRTEPKMGAGPGSTSLNPSPLIRRDEPRPKAAG